jgi:hypothetical protein
MFQSIDTIYIVNYRGVQLGLALLTCLCEIDLAVVLRLQAAAVG